ncbi:MAG: hypothetical protein AAF333_01090 [Planctomycetota bacterium]
MPDPAWLDRHFPRYTDFDPLVPIWCVTPDDAMGGSFHRFFDTSPISPSGRLLAFTRMPQEDHAPAPGEAAHIGIVDLATGEQRLVAETRGWEPQMGANVNWGVDDTQLIFNDVDPTTWNAFAVRCNVATGDKTRLGGPVYHVSPDGHTAAGSNPIPMRRTQPGYGVMIPEEHVPRFVGPQTDDGLWLTDTQTGESRLALSIYDAITRATPAFELEDRTAAECEIYGFHAKWSPDGSQLIWTLRFFRDDGTSRFGVQGTPDIRFTVLTVTPDGQRVRNAVPTRYWRRRGHHINWTPDSRGLSMNLQLEDDGPLRLVGCAVDGSGLGPIVGGVVGSGHPTVHPTANHVLTDVYAHEPFAFGDGTTPLRWIALDTGGEQTIARFPSRTAAQKHDGVMRLDPHPAWDRTWRWVTFNAMIDGTRRVMLADMQPLLG